MKQPNILFLMTDQQRWDALGCLWSAVPTPHLDRLVASGVRFSQAVCQCPICVPSRHSMMLGLYPSQSGLRFNRQICPSDADLPLPVLPQRLQAAGYQTAGFGKTHWYDPGLGVKEPSRRGFEIRGVLHEGLDHIAERGARYMEDDFGGGPVPSMVEFKQAGSGGESIVGYSGKTSAYPSAEHREGWACAQAEKFLRAERDPARPFFLYVSFDHPHAPLYVPPGYEERVDPAAIEDRLLAADPTTLPTHWLGGHSRPVMEHWKTLPPEKRRETTRRYLALVAHVDDLFGRVLRALEETGQADNTLIVFTSDHGEMLGDRNHHFGKYCLYEGSVRVPLVFSGSALPARLRGTTDDRPSELVDILPTLLAAAGHPVSAELPGVNLLGEGPRKAGSFCEFHGGGYEKFQNGPAWMWRTPEWKLILHHPAAALDASFDPASARVELYDLVHDPVELRDLSADPAHAATRARLTQELCVHVMTHFARFPRKTTDVPLVYAR